MNRRPFLRQTLDLRLSQRLALTPSLLQKIELLQLNKLELQEMLNQELVENPILEEVPEQETPAEMTLDDGAGEDPAIPDDSRKEGEKDSFEEIDFRYFFDEYLDTGYKNREVEDSEKPSFEAFLTKAPSLEEHLNWQLGLSDAKPRIAEIAKQIIGNLSEDGYLLLGIEELCEVSNCTPEEAAEALATVQAMDTVGIGARDLRECLSLQLESLELKESLAYKIVQDHLSLLESHKFKEIAARTGALFEEVLQAVDCIKHLIPKPGRSTITRTRPMCSPRFRLQKSTTNSSFC